MILCCFVLVTTSSGTRCHTPSRGTGEIFLHVMILKSTRVSLQRIVQSFCGKVVTVMENMIVTGEAEEVVCSFLFHFFKS